MQLKIHLPTSCSAVRAFYSNLLNHMVLLCHMWTSTVSHSNVLCHVVATRICFHRSLIHLPSIFPRSLSNTEPPSDMSSTKYSIWPAGVSIHFHNSFILHMVNVLKKSYYFLICDRYLIYLDLLSSHLMYIFPVVSSLFNIS